MATRSTRSGSRRHRDFAARFAVRAAVAAPSVHNTQPWYFVSHQGVIGLCADPRRGLPLADPAGREMVISCGAALFNLRLAVRHLGFADDVRLLPDPSRPNLLAEIRWGRYVAPSRYGELLFSSISRRHTHRGAFTEQAPPLLIGELSKLAREERAELHIIYDAGQHRPLADLIRAAELAQRANPGFDAELARWSPPPRSVRADGVPPAAYPRQPDGLEFTTRDFARGEGWGYPTHSLRDGRHALGMVMLLATRDDSRLGWLLAGQALERILLHVTAHSVKAAFHTQPLELAAPREQIRRYFTDGAYPQMLLRLGSGGRCGVTPRRQVTHTLIEDDIRQS
ncbi:MAG: Acg family FMN-binding oxidoreductase [Micromonosporaceae bacterium]